jgi:hypothetical protein
VLDGRGDPSRGRGLAPTGVPRRAGIALSPEEAVTHPDQSKSPFDHEVGDRKIIVADSHDVATGHGSERWRTPSGALLVEGESYEMEWRIEPWVVRIESDGTEKIRERPGWRVVSEALPHG